jgi:uncharacterized membrane protein YdbT with pleckstrin-like domain
MSYIKESLMPGERVMYKTRQHDVSTLRPVAVVIAGALAGLFLTARYGGFWGAAIMIAAAFAGVPSLARHYASEFGVTNRRVFIKTGWLFCKSMETVLNKVGVITVKQDLMGRLLGYGTVIVTGFGGAKEELERIPAPYKFRRKIFEQVSAPKTPPVKTDMADTAGD